MHPLRSPLRHAGCRPRGFALTLALVLAGASCAGSAPAVADKDGEREKPKSSPDPSASAVASAPPPADMVLEPLVLAESAVPPSPPPATTAPKGATKPSDEKPALARKEDALELEALAQAQKEADNGHTATKLGVSAAALTFDVAAVQKIVREGLPAMRACSEQAHSRGEAVPGRATLAFTIRASGEVTDVALDGQVTDALRRCIAAVVEPMRFPHPSASTRVSTPLRFGDAASD